MKRAVAVLLPAAEGAPRVTYQIEADPPYRLVRWSADDGEEASLTGSSGLAYWKLNGPASPTFGASACRRPHAVVLFRLSHSCRVCP